MNSPYNRFNVTREGRAIVIQRPPRPDEPISYQDAKRLAAYLMGVAAEIEDETIPVKLIEH